jgi:pyruvate carboxylase subunit B
MYLQGRYGRAPGTINETVRKMAIGDDEVISDRPADRLKPEMERLAQDIGDLARCTEDVLTYAMFPDVGRAFLEARAGGTLSLEALLPAPGTATSTDSTAPTDFNVTVHGETYHLKITGAGHRNEERRPFYVTVDGVPEEILVETLGEIIPTGDAAGSMRPAGKVSRRPKASREGHVTSSMPGTIVDVMVKVGDTIKAGDPVLVIEAMKMENEVPATVTGSVTAVHIVKGDSVNPDEALIEIA